ncbi:MAG: right-handed parallel beta-helix repeat-containing protein [Acidimicrobiia bacterium]|nr:right-handed parallel beta-helix repeat-containing protein [Acidimicrobiia bacterium]
MRTIFLLVVALTVAVAPVPAFAQEEPVEIYEMVFPLVGENTYGDTWGAARSGGRTHQGTDILADKMIPVVAAADGTVGWMHNDQGTDRCCAMALYHDDGWQSWYIHLNNDTPGTDDGLGWGFADGIEPGVHVTAGQLIGYVGDSGNAEWTVSHLHFELHDASGTPINAYEHLLAATVLDTPLENGDPIPEPEPPVPVCPVGASCDVVAMVSSGAQYKIWSELVPGAPTTSFFYGNPGDVALMGDWDGDGIKTPAMYRPTNGFMYLRNSNTQGTGEIEYFYGDPSDVPLAGDWDGDGDDTLAIYRPHEGKFYIKNTLGTGIADYSFYFGNPGDKPFVGDFNGDGTDTVGLHRASTGYVYFRNTNTTGPADLSFFYGDPGDKILAGDWNGNGTDTVAVYRPSTGTIYFNNTNAAGQADHSLTVGTYASIATATAFERTTPAGVRIEVGQNFQATIDSNPAGTTYIIASGTHRLQTATPKDGDQFIGEPGATLSGARVLTEFTKVNGTWVAYGQTQEAGERNSRCINGYSGCRFFEDVFLDGAMLWQVTNRADLAPGMFYFDYANDSIHLADDPTGRRVEASLALRAAFDGFADNVRIEGLIVEGYRTGIRASAGHGWAIIRNEVRLNHGTGIRGGNSASIIGNYAHHNGAYGVSAYRADDLLVHGNQIAFNNIAGFDPAWDAGGTKFAEGQGLTITSNHVHDNYGTGLWVDGSNTGVVYENNLVENNQRNGISHEISYAAVIRNNQVRGNGLYGIYVSSSPGVEVVGNTITNNGVADIRGFYDPARGVGPFGAFELRDLWVHGNVITIGSGRTGIDRFGSGNQVWDSWNNRFDNNVYVIPNGGRPFAWHGDNLTFAEWQLTGNDVHSEIRTGG